MLAGVCGIDFALLVVAADDGIMPQTLRASADTRSAPRAAAPRSSPRSIAEPARVDPVAAKRGGAARGNRTQEAPVLPSPPTGEGVSDLRNCSRAKRRARGAPEHRSSFRLAIDRAFTIAGSGTVVTGTVFQRRGQARRPAHDFANRSAVRVRGIQIQGKAARSATAGQRLRLNPPAPIWTVRRGDWVLAEAIHGPRSVSTRASPCSPEAQPLRHWTPVHLHLGTADVTARIAMQPWRPVAPGSARRQLVLDKPIGALHGDRFILRDQSATAHPRRRHGARSLAAGAGPPPAGTAYQRLYIDEEREPAAALSELISGDPGWVDLQRFAQMSNMTDEEASACWIAAGLKVASGPDRPFGFSVPVSCSSLSAPWKPWAPTTRRRRIVPASSPSGFGWPRQRAFRRRAVLPRGILAELLHDKAIKEADGPWLRLPGHSLRLTPADDLVANPAAAEGQSLPATARTRLRRDPLGARRGCAAIAAPPREDGRTGAGHAGSLLPAHDPGGGIADRIAAGSPARARR